MPSFQKQKQQQYQATVLQQWHEIIRVIRRQTSQFFIIGNAPINQLFEIAILQLYMHGNSNILPSFLNSKRYFIPKEYRQRKEIESSAQPSSKSASRKQHSDTSPHHGSQTQKDHALIKVKSFVTEQQDQPSDSSYDISRRQQQQGNLTQQFLDELHTLDYESCSFHQLKDAFLEIVAGHIELDVFYPIPTSTLGQMLISDGLFHEMWGRIIMKFEFNFQSWIYYQRYAPHIARNHTNFEKMFNHESSADGIPAVNEVNCDSNTNLQKKPLKVKEAVSKQHQSLSRSLSFEYPHNVSAKENDEGAGYNQGNMDDGGRLRLLDQIQTNGRRLNAEIVCFFLQIMHSYRLEDVQISRLLETAWGSNSQMVIFEGHIQKYHPLLAKQVVDYRPKLLLSLYGEVNLKQLLRLKHTYGAIEGFVVYDQNFSIKNWLRSQHFDMGWCEQSLNVQ